MPLLKEMLVVINSWCSETFLCLYPSLSTGEKGLEREAAFSQVDRIYRVDTENGTKHGRETPERFPDGFCESSRC